MPRKPKQPSEPDPRLPPEVPVHPVSREEWDDTFRAALTGIIAKSGSEMMSYPAAVQQARIWASFAHGERPRE